MRKILFPDLFLLGQWRNASAILAQVCWMMGKSTEQQTLLRFLRDPFSFNPCHENPTSGRTAISWFRLSDSQRPLRLEVAKWTRTSQSGMSRARSDLFPSSVCQARGMPSLKVKQRSYEHDNETLLLLRMEKQKLEGLGRWQYSELPSSGFRWEQPPIRLSHPSQVLYKSS